MVWQPYPWVAQMSIKKKRRLKVFLQIHLLMPLRKSSYMSGVNQNGRLHLRHPHSNGLNSPRKTHFRSSKLSWRQTDYAEMNRNLHSIYYLKTTDIDSKSWWFILVIRFQYYKNQLGIKEKITVWDKRRDSTQSNVLQDVRKYLILR